MTAPAPTDASPPANRLSIAHLLLWLSTTSVLLALAPPLRPRFTGMPAYWQLQEDIERFNGVMNFVMAPVYGAAIAAVMLSIWRVLTRRFGFPSQPGHWIMFVVAALGIGRVAAITSILTLTIGVGVSIAAIVFSNSYRWRAVFLIGGLNLLTAALLPVLRRGPVLELINFLCVFFIASLLGVLASTVIAACVDFRCRDRFDVFHWIGVCTLFGPVAHALGFVAIVLQS